MFLILFIVLLVSFTRMTLIFYAVHVLEASYTALEILEFKTFTNMF